MLRVAVCDEDNLVIEKLEIIINQLNFNLYYDVFFSGDELLKYMSLNKIKYNIYFINIEMKGKNGLEVAAIIRKDDKRAILNFMSSHDDYVYDVFEFMTFQYIKKPISYEKGKEIVLKNVKYLEESKKIFYYAIGKEIFTMYMEDIMYFACNHRTITISAIENKIIFYSTMKELLNHLESYFFVRIHASFIVNLENIIYMGKNKLIVKNGEEIPISRSHSIELRNKFAEYLECKSQMY